MIRSIVLAAGVIISYVFCCQIVAQEPSTNSVRKQDWNKLLNETRYGIPAHYSGPLTSLGQFEANCKVHIVFDPKHKFDLEFEFWDEHRVLSIRGHDQSAFATFENCLYFADYPRDSAGCTVVAYDLTSGASLWRSDLHQSKPNGHSAYRNIVAIRMSRQGEIEGEPAGSAVVVTGKESYSDYVEVLDSRTGNSLAIKEYRIGFGDPKSDAGAFGGVHNTPAEKGAAVAEPANRDH